MIYKKWKDNYLNLIQKISNRRGWNASDCNPFFYIIFDHLHKSNALSLREFKKQLKERKKNNVWCTILFFSRLIIFFNNFNNNNIERKKNHE